MSDGKPLKWTSAWSFVDKWYPPAKNGDRWRDNWDRIFKPKIDDKEETTEPEEKIEADSHTKD